MVNLSLGIRGSYVVGFDGSEHRMIKDGIVIVEDKRISMSGRATTGELTGG